MLIRDLLRSKGGDVVTIRSDRGIADAIQLLVQHRIGAVVVVDDGQIRGILSERDVLRVAAKDPTLLARDRVADHMTTNVIVGVAGDSIDYVMEILTKNRIRHLPIVEDGRLVGLISIGDVVNALRTGLETENRYLRDYVHGIIA
jgi:CBS domain-containing protein